YGPGNTANIYQWVDAICRGRFACVGENSNRKSIVSVANLVAAVVHLLDRLEPGCQVFYITDRQTLSVRELADLIGQIAGCRKPVRRIPQRVAQTIAAFGDIVAKINRGRFPITSERFKSLTQQTWFSCAKLLRTGFEHPQTTEAGLTQMIRWYQSTRN